MNTAAMYVLANTASITCILVAGYMAIKEKSGWGWFLFVALLLTASIKKGGGA